MFVIRLLLILAVTTGTAATATGSCIEPMRPDPEYLVDGGYNAQEIRNEFRTYFSEVEESLNCLNRSAARIRQEATAAARDYDRVLDQHPVKPGQDVE